MAILAGSKKIADAQHAMTAAPQLDPASDPRVKRWCCAKQLVYLILIIVLVVFYYRLDWLLTQAG